MDTSDRQPTIDLAVEGAGYRAAMAPSSKAEHGAADIAEEKRARREFWRLAYAIAFTLPLVMEMVADLFGHHLIPGWKQALLATPVQFWAGAPFYAAAWRALRARSGNMDLLVTLGTSAAYGFSLYQLATSASHLYFEASAVVVTLVLLRRWLEARARRSASALLRA